MAAINKKDVVGARGFEPPTSRSQTERTTRLCYAPRIVIQCFDRPNLKGAILAGALRRGQDSLMQRYQEIARRCEGPTAMANLVFHLRVQLREC